MIAQRNLLTCRTRRKVLDDLATAAADTEDTHVRTCVVKHLDLLKKKKNFHCYNWKNTLQEMSKRSFVFRLLSKVNALVNGPYSCIV